MSVEAMVVCIWCVVCMGCGCERVVADVVWLQAAVQLSVCCSFHWRWLTALWTSCAALQSSSGAARASRGSACQYVCVECGAAQRGVTELARGGRADRWEWRHWRVASGWTKSATER